MYDVAVVIPVYNEAECIGGVVDDWIGTLDSMGLSYRLIVLNDGSKDNTAQVLKSYRDDPTVYVINKPNSGHGPTILMGYRQAVREAEWVFQVDSDNEMRPADFSRLWREREAYDALIGIRETTDQPFARQVVTAVSRIVVYALYGTSVKDVNCPFRLMRSAVLMPLLDYIPNDTFAPNIAISGLLALGRRRTRNLPVQRFSRETGEVSIRKWKLFRAAVKSFTGVVAIRFRVSKKRLGPW